MHPHDHTHDHDEHEDFPAPNYTAITESLTTQLASQIRRSLELESALVETRNALSALRAEHAAALYRLTDLTAEDVDTTDAEIIDVTPSEQTDTA